MGGELWRRMQAAGKVAAPSSLLQAQPGPEPEPHAGRTPTHSKGSPTLYDVPMAPALTTTDGLSCPCPEETPEKTLGP